jgi:hypothetical protein
MRLGKYEWAGPYFISLLYIWTLYKYHCVINRWEILTKIPLKQWQKEMGTK